MSNLIPIGRFSQITRLSIKALRIYAEQGLLCPAYVDPDSGYRYYNLNQARMAARIRLLRALSMPLDEIHDVMHAEQPAAVRALLLRHRKRISGQIAHYQHTLVLLSRLLENQEEFMPYTIQVKEVTPQPIVSIRMRIPPDTFGQAVPPAMIELFAYAGRLGIQQQHLPPMAIHHDYSEEAADIEVAVPVERVVAGEGRITSRIIAGGRVAYVMLVGPYEELGEVYPALAAWVQEHGHQTSGPPRELFWTNPEQVPNPADYQTEVLWPIG